MEEKKIVGKEVKMNVVKSEGTEEKPQKLTYEQLNQACIEMSQQLQNQNAYIQRMREQMQQLDLILQTKRLDYLFKVVELRFKSPIFNDEFYFACVDEIQRALTIPEKKEEKEDKEEE